MRKIRFSVRSMMIAIAICTITLWVFGFPGRRAQRLVRLVRNGEVKIALAMLDDLPEDALEYRVVVEHVASNPPVEKSTRDLRRIELQSPTLWQLLKLQRTVWVGKGWGGGDCQLIVTPTSIRPGRNNFNML